MNCPQCKQPIEHDAKFCRQCGMEVALMPVRPCCAVCGAEMDEAHHFCGKCGASVQTMPENISPEVPTPAKVTPPPQEQPTEEKSPVIVEPEVVAPPPVEVSPQPTAPAKKGNPLALAIVFIAILAIFVLAILMFGNQESEEDSSSTPTQAEIQVETQVDIEEELSDVVSGQVETLTPTESNAPDEQGVSDELLPYVQVIENYLVAYDNGWIATDLVNSQVTSRSNLNDIGYAFVDFNEDGTKELVIGFVDTPTQFISVYSMVDGVLTEFIASSVEVPHYITNAGLFMRTEAISSETNTTIYFRLTSTGVSAVVEAIAWDSSTEEILYFYIGPSWDYDAVEISAAQIASVADGYTEQALIYTPFSMEYAENMQYAWDTTGAPEGFTPDGSWNNRAVLFEEIAQQTTSSFDMDALFAADIFGSTFYMAYDEGWLDEWLSLYINGSSDPGPDHYTTQWYDDILEEWTLYGISRADASAAGWGYIWDELME